VNKILLTQPQPISEQRKYEEISNKYNVKFEAIPFVQLELINSRELRQQQVIVSEYEGILFYSVGIVDLFFRLCNELKLTIHPDVKYFCINENVAYYLQKYITYKKRRVFFGNNSFDALTEQFNKFKEIKYLLPITDQHNSEKTKDLNKFNLNVKFFKVSNTVYCDLKNLNINDYDMIIFYTPSDVLSFLKSFPNFKKKNILIGACGNRTYETIKKNKIQVDLNAPTEKCPSIITAIENILQKKLKQK